MVCVNHMALLGSSQLQECHNLCTLIVEQLHGVVCADTAVFSGAYTLRSVKLDT